MSVERQLDSRGIRMVNLSLPMQALLGVVIGTVLCAWIGLIVWVMWSFVR